MRGVVSSMAIVTKKLSARARKRLSGKRKKRRVPTERHPTAKHFTSASPITEAYSTLMAAPFYPHGRGAPPEPPPPTLRSPPFPYESWEPGAPTLRSGELSRSGA